MLGLQLIYVRKGATGVEYSICVIWAQYHIVGMGDVNYTEAINQKKTAAK